MDTLLTKHTIAELYESGYRGAVLVPVADDLAGIRDGIIAAKLSTSEKAIRTLQQNKSIYLYGNLVSELLNNGGITKQVYFEAKQIDCEWTPEAVIEDIWREFQFAMYGHRKTSKLSTDQVSKVYEQVARVLSENFNVTQSFPDRFNQMYEQMARNNSY